MVKIEVIYENSEKEIRKQYNITFEEYMKTAREIERIVENIARFLHYSKKP